MLLALLLSALVGSSVWWNWASSLNELVYDQLLQLRSKDPPADVIIIAIDEYSLSHVGEWPWSRRYHARLVNTLTEAGVKAVGYDIVFAEPNPMDPDGDAAFVQAIEANGNVVLPVYIDRTQLGGQLIEVLPHPMFAEAAHMGHVNTELDSDGIVRRFYHYEGIGDAFWPHFATVVARLTGDYRQPPAQTDAEADVRVSPLVNVRRLPRLIPFLGGVGSFQQVSFYDVISGKVPPRLFKERVVFVGATSISLGDLLPTPVTVQGEQMPGVEINATIFNAAREDGFIIAVERSWRVAAGVLYVLVTLLLIPRIAGRSSLLLIVFSSVLLIAIQAVLLLRFNLWLPLASALLGQWLIYPLWTVLRLDQTLRYLKKQLILLREELGQQSLAEHHENSGQSLVAGVERLMDMASIKDYGLYLNQRLVAGQAVSQSEDQLLSLPHGTACSENLFSCRYRFREQDDCTLLVPLAQQSGWSDLKGAYVSGFFESELAANGDDYVGTYDVVFKYLNEVRRSQVEVNNARLLFEYCVGEMNDGVVIADEYGEVLFINRLALNYLGIHSREGKSLVDLLMHLSTRSDQDDWHQVIFNLLADQGSRELETVTESGEILLANLSYLEVSAHRANLIVINLYDITRIREAQRLRNETIDFLSHDMRSPMVSLLALVNQKRSGSGDDAFLDQIEHYANKNLYFAEQFLQLARVESDQSLSVYDIDFEAIVRNAVDDVYSQAREAGMVLSLEVDDDMFWVKGNGELLERAVVNLLTNAIKYGPPNSTINTQLQRLETDSLRFSVIDHGPGIPVEQQKLLFAPYQRLKTATDAKHKGAGLGLRFVDVTIRRHRGEVFFESKPGHTVFGFTLPVIDID